MDCSARHARYVAVEFVEGLSVPLAATADLGDARDWIDASEVPAIVADMADGGRIVAQNDAFRSI